MLRQFGYASLLFPSAEAPFFCKPERFRQGGLSSSCGEAKKRPGVGLITCESHAYF